MAAAGFVLALAAGVSGQFVWNTELGYHLSDLPLPGTSTCCGSDLVGDPTLGKDSPTCLCDTTDGECDSGCCCDLDCTYDALRLGGFFGCTSNGTEARPQGFTVCSGQLISTNIPQRASDSGLVEAFGGADGLLCVISDNSPARGAFFRDPVATTSLSAAQVSREIESRLPIQYLSWLSSATGSLPSSFYTLDAPVLGDGCTSMANDDGCSRRAPVVLPALSFDGGCHGTQRVPFLTGVEAFSCSLGASGASLAELCGTLLNASFLRHSAFAAAPASSAGDATLTLHVDNRNSTTSGFTVSADVPASKYDSASGTCMNALLLYQLRLSVGSGGTVDSVDIYVRLDSLDAQSWPTTHPRFGAGFEYAGGEPLTRQTSGRPGYQRGLPLLIADGIDVRKGGLALLPRTALGHCATGRTGASTVLFGEAMATCAGREESNLRPLAL